MDGTCLVHGRKTSEHQCLYCCLCFKSLLKFDDTPNYDDMHKLPNGQYEDVCLACAKQEEERHKIKERKVT